MDWACFVAVVEEPRSASTTYPSGFALRLRPIAGSTPRLVDVGLITGSRDYLEVHQSAGGA